MFLKDLIAYLESKDATTVLSHGFAHPHSYRGDYAELAFEPAENVTVDAMLRDARGALGATYTGYKGGDYRMADYTDVYLAAYGSTGDALSVLTLDAMFSAQAMQELVALCTGILECLEQGDTWKKPARDHAAGLLRKALGKVRS